MFAGCKNFKGKGLENWDVSNVKEMISMFNGCEQFNCDLSKWDVSSVTNMYSLFKRCNKFTGKGLENWDVSAVTDMHYMFDGKHGKTIDKVKLPKWAKERWYDFL